MNKILVFGGLAVFAILLIENMVMPSSAFVLWATSKGYVLVVASTLVGFSIGFGLKGYTSTDSKGDDSEMDF